MVGWALMAVAMTLPTAIPLIAAAGRASRGTPSGLGGAAGMLALGVVMTLEERERAGERLRRPLGLALLAAAVLTLVWAV